MKYIFIIKRNDSCEYKATLIKQAVDALNKYLVCHSLILQINLYDKYIFSDLHNILHGKIHNLQKYSFSKISDLVAINS